MTIQEQIREMYYQQVMESICDFGETPEEANDAASTNVHLEFDKVIGVMNVSKALSYFRTV